MKERLKKRRNAFNFNCETIVGKEKQLRNVKSPKAYGPSFPISLNIFLLDVASFLVVHFQLMLYKP